MSHFSARYQRFQCEIVKTCDEIEAFERTRKDEPWLSESKNLTETAQAALYAGAIDGAWALLETARRKLVYGKKPSECRAIAHSVEMEITDKEKFPKDHWRTQAIERHLRELKSIKAGLACIILSLRRSSEISAGYSKLEEILTVRDDRLNNIYYKDAMTREQVFRLLIVLAILAVAATFLVTVAIYDIMGVLNLKENSNKAPVTARLTSFISIAVFGAIGATFSALTDLAGSKAETRIPKHAWSTWITIMRPVIGAVSALIATFALLGGILPALSKTVSTIPETEFAYFVWMLSFAAGFSERLVIQAVSAAAKSKE